MTSSLSYFQLSIQDFVATLTINRVDKANALNVDAWKELKEVMEALSEDRKVRVVVLNANGKFFCAGMDVQSLLGVSQEFMPLNEENSEKLYQFILMLQECVSSLEKCSKPVIAAVQGPCIGGGVDLITAADMRFSCDEAYFSVKEIDLGIVADMGTLQRLPQIVPNGVAKEWIYTGRNVNGLEAERCGLVNKHFESQSEMDNFINDLVATITAKSPKTISGIKTNLNYSSDNSIKDGLDFVAKYNSKNLLNEDLFEAFQAFLEKRKPKFK